MKTTHAHTPSSTSGESNALESGANRIDRSHVKLLASVLGESEEVVLAALESHQSLNRIPVVSRRRH